MKTKIIEATNGTNYGKFLLGRLDTEYARRAKITDEGRALIPSLGWSPEHLWVLDLQTGEGAFFLPGGLAAADLNDRHQIWVCPMYEPFLTWLYRQDLSDLDALPDLVQVEGESALYGYRRAGKDIT